jgi:hypothetical protein
VGHSGLLASWDALRRRGMLLAGAGSLVVGSPAIGALVVGLPTCGVLVVNLLLSGVLILFC